MRSIVPEKCSCGLFLYFYAPGIPFLYVFTISNFFYTWIIKVAHLMFTEFCIPLHLWPLSQYIFLHLPFFSQHQTLYNLLYMSPNSN